MVKEATAVDMHYVICEPPRCVSETFLLSLSINHRLRMFKHNHLKEAVQALFQRQDVFITVKVAG